VPLRRPNVVVRVRPLAESGGHSNERDAVYKRLASWDDNVVVMEDDVGTANGSMTGVRSQSFTFAKGVLGTAAKQPEVYGAVAANVVKACTDGYCAFLFAYGQTGTGKTHTIFGPESSWRDIRHAESGILPRAVATILEAMAAKAATTAFTLSASAMEFYMCHCTDLLDDGAPCLIGADHKPLGLASVPIESDTACLQFMARVREQRHTRATYMNGATDGHEGSSRSHCAMILTLRQLDRASATVLTTELHIMDMAGAERPKSNGYEADKGHSSAALAIIEHERGAEPGLADQGIIINYELSQLRTAVVQASEQHQKGLPLLNAKALNTNFVEYAKGCFDGSALLSMIVTLSPAQGCGWETWFSCTYGIDLQKLRCPVQPQKPRSLAKLISATEAAIEKSAGELAHANNIEANNKYVVKRGVMARHEARLLEQLRRLEAGGAAPYAPETSANDGFACVIS